MRFLALDIFLFVHSEINIRYRKEGVPYLFQLTLSDFSKFSKLTFKSHHVVMDFLLQVLTSLFADKDDLRLKGAPLAFLIIYVDVSSGLGSLNTIRIIRRNQPICNTWQVSKLPRTIGSSEIWRELKMIRN